MIWKCWVLLLLAVQAGAQSRWTGSASNNQWTDAVNWEPARVPAASDDVLLDNSLLAGTYRVLLPDTGVQVRSLRIFPAEGSTILVELPLSNVISSAGGSLLPRAFETLGGGYGLDIGSGGIFLNASGSGSGYAVRISDSIRIANGGRYIHRSRTGHAELVQQLSRLPGTEEGVFRFENTDAASTFSLSGRTFGTVQLSAAFSPAGIISYSSSGTNKAVIRGNLELEPGVNFSLHFEDTLWVNGDLRIDSASFNLSSGNRIAVLWLQKNWIQKDGAIRESNVSGTIPSIILGGSAPQLVNSSGLVADSVLVSIRNPAGIRLETSLRIQYGLELVNGVISSEGASRVQLGKGALIFSDSSNGQSYIDGELVKEGLEGEYSIFPLGTSGMQRWISVKGLHGDIAVTYHRESALDLGPQIGPGIDHVSQLEYWAVRKLKEGLAAGGDAQLELSFDEEFSGGVSYLPDLRVASFNAGFWENAGNSGVKGAAFAAGSVTSQAINGMGTDNIYFTLASASAGSNVLPVLFEKVWINGSVSRTFLNWQVAGLEEAAEFSLELSTDGRSFAGAGKIAAVSHLREYRLAIPDSFMAGFCRVRYSDKNGRSFFSNPVRYNRNILNAGGLKVTKKFGGSGLLISSPENMGVQVEITDLSGRLLWRKEQWFSRGSNHLELNGTFIPAGIYILRMYGNNGSVLVQKLVL